MYCKDIRAEEIARNQHLLVPDDKERLLRAPYKKSRDTFEAKYTGKCFCGSVKFELAEDPLGTPSFVCILTKRAISHVVLSDASYCHWYTGILIYWRYLIFHSRHQTVETVSGTLVYAHMTE